MWKWLDRRRHSRRDEDLRAKFDEVLLKKQEAARLAIEKMRQFKIDGNSYTGPERRAQQA